MTHARGLRTASLSPDGRTVLTGGERDRTARLWSVTTGKPISTPLKHPLEVTAVAFSPDGRIALTGCRDGIVRYWDAVSGAATGVWLQHKDMMDCIGFSPDGRIVLTGSWDGTARMWDFAIGKPIGPPLMHKYPVVRVAFSPSGRKIVTVPQYGSPVLWDVEELPDDLPRVAAWIEVITGLTLNAQGEVQVLDRPAWLERREELLKLGGPPMNGTPTSMNPVKPGPGQKSLIH